MSTEVLDSKLNISAVSFSVDFKNCEVLDLFFVGDIIKKVGLGIFG